MTTYRLQNLHSNNCSRCNIAKRDTKEGYCLKCDEILDFLVEYKDLSFRDPRKYQFRFGNKIETQFSNFEVKKYLEEASYRRDIARLQDNFQYDFGDLYSISF